MISSYTIHIIFDDIKYRDDQVMRVMANDTESAGRSRYFSHLVTSAILDVIFLYPIILLASLPFELEDSSDYTLLLGRIGNTVVPPQMDFAEESVKQKDFSLQSIEVLIEIDLEFY